MRWYARVLAGVLLAIAAPVHASLIQITETLLTVDAALDRDAHASGLNTVFVTDRGGTRDVFMLDAFGSLSIVAGGPGNQDDPDIDGGRVVYVDDTHGNLNIAVADLVAGTRRLLTVDAGRDVAPVISGNTVAFTTTRGGTSDIFGYDLATEQLFGIAIGPGDATGPAIDNSLVTWTIFQNGSFDIIATDLGGTPFIVAGSATHEVAPSVSGSRIAYLTDEDVAVYDRATQTTTGITNDPFEQNSVVIDGNLVAWSDNRNGNYDIFLHDLNDGSTHQLTSDPLDQFLSDLDGDRILFYDRRLDDFNVWQLTVELSDSPVPVSEPYTLLLLGSGMAGLIVLKRKREHSRGASGLAESPRR